MMPKKTELTIAGEFTKKDFLALQAEYEKNFEKEYFIWNGQEMFTQFAKYLVEYLSTKFK